MHPAPTVRAAMKINFLRRCPKADSKKHRISADVEVEIRGEDDFLVDKGVTSFGGRMEQYEIIGNTWAVAGCYDVDTKVEGATVAGSLRIGWKQMSMSETCAGVAST